MPLFTLQLTAQGPIMTAFVGVSGARRAALFAAKQDIPTPVQIRALVDTAVPGALATHLPLWIENMPVLCAELLVAQGFHALIGRDILSLCLLSYNGVAGSFTLAY